jgi:hypothetical protein
VTALIIVAACAAFLVVTWAALRRFDGSREAPGHAERAREHRARRRAGPVACRRARAMWAWVTSWFWWWDSPAGWHPWQAARERIHLRAAGNTWGRRAITRRIQQLRKPPGAGMVAGENPARLHDSGHETPAPGLPEPTRLATEAERHEAAQDGPLYSWQTGEFAAIVEEGAS